MNWKVFILISALLSLTGCAKKDAVTPVSVSREEISFTTYKERELTKSTPLGSGDTFNVCAYQTVGTEESSYYTSELYSYDSGMNCFTSDPGHYWPEEGTLDFYAVSPVSYVGSVGLIAADKTVNFTADGETDFTAVLLAAQSKPLTAGTGPKLSFGHKLTKVAFRVTGKETHLKYVIESATLKADNSSTYSFSPSDLGSWSVPISSDTYDLISSTLTLPYHTPSGLALGDALYLIPRQRSDSETVKLTLTYKVYEQNAEDVVSDRLVYAVTHSVDLTSSAVSNWGINRSIVYNLVLPSDDAEGSGTISFTASVTDWYDDTEIEITDDDIKALKFRAEAEQTVYLKSYSSTYNFEYSWNGKDWTIWTYSSPLTFGTIEHPKVYIRGDNPTGFTIPVRFKFSTSAPVYCDGNVMHLLSSTVDLYEIPCESCFFELFYYCTVLQTAPDLPATVLTAECYQNMFYGTSITAAPELPAMVIPAYAYNRMFAGCSRLVSAPELPAVTLLELNNGLFSVGSNYESMFESCSSLVSVPSLPATKLTPACYSMMFYGCSSLTYAPVLPADTVPANAYSSMFNGCTKLTDVPDLTATSLLRGGINDQVGNNYRMMFAYCRSLVNAPRIAVTSLTPNCCEGMFRYDTSLVVAPELKATILVSGCYNYMFQGCKKLNNVKAMFTTTPGSTYTDNWLYGVASEGLFTKNRAATWDVSGASGIPSDWYIWWED